jgi:phosphate transport system protein
VPEELRLAFHKKLEEVEEKTQQLFGLVIEAVAGATEAFLSGDREAAQAVVKRDKELDRLDREVETLILQLFALQSPMAGDLRFLLSVLRVAPELERSGDLAKKIAQRATRGVATDLTPRMRGMIEQMGNVAVEMWRMSADAFANRDVELAKQVEERDDELDELHMAMLADLVTGTVPVGVALEMALVDRFFERLGDHAEKVANRVSYIVSGQQR